MKKYRILLLFLTILITLPVLSEDADSIYVIVNQQAELSKLDQKQVMSIFLGRARNFPNGLTAKVFDRGIHSSIRETFFENLTGKQLSDIDAYWARLSYSGRAFPPKSIEKEADILDEVIRNKHAISYIKGKPKEALSDLGIVVVFTIEGHE